jgi:hypothetical protein
MIIETIISTINNKGEVNFAPFGIKRNKKIIYISPYIPSKTLNNLISTKSAVINYINECSYFVDCIIGEKKFNTSRSHEINGYYLKNSLAHDEVRVLSVKEDEIRPTFKCEVIGEYLHKKYPGYNRANGAVIEACILATRVKMLKKTKIENELNYLNISVEKTAGKNELKSWHKIKKFIENELIKK